MRKIHSLGISLMILVAAAQSALASENLAEHPCNSELLSYHYLDSDNTLDCEIRNNGNLVYPTNIPTISFIVILRNSQGDIKGYDLSRDAPPETYRMYGSECRPRRSTTGSVHFTLTPREKALYANTFECAVANSSGRLPEMSDRAKTVMLIAGASCQQIGINDPKECQSLSETVVTDVKACCLAPVETFYCPTDIPPDFPLPEDFTLSGDPQRTAQRMGWMQRCRDATLAAARTYYHDNTLTFVEPLTDWCKFSQPILDVLGFKCEAGTK